MSALFLSASANQHLEHDYYVHIARHLSGKMTTTYLYSDNENVVAESNLGEKSTAFDKVIKHPFPILNKSRRSASGIIYFIQYCKRLITWRNQYLEIVDKLTPTIIVLINPNLVNALILSKYRSQYKLLYLQSSYSKRTFPKKISLRGHATRIFYNYILKTPVKSLHDNPLLADGIATYFFWSEKWLPKHKVSAHKINANYTGFPMYDKVFEKYVPHKTIPKTPNVLIILNKEIKMGMSNWLIYKELYWKLFNEFCEFNFLIKPHPLGGKDVVCKHFNGLKIVEKFDWSEVDLVITHWSTASTESIIRGIPTILVNPEGQFDFKIRNLDDYDAIAKDLNDIRKYINNFSNEETSKFSEYRRKFLQSSLGSNSGDSTTRLVNQLVKEGDKM